MSWAGIGSGCARPPAMTTGTNAAPARTSTAATATSAGQDGSAGRTRTRRRSAPRPKARRAAARNLDRPPEGSHHHEAIQKKSDRNGTAVHGARTTSNPGRRSSASRLTAAIVRGGTRGGGRATMAAVIGIPTFILVLSGAATGLVGAMLGLGGGVFLVPLLTLALGVPIRTAIAASLISVIATASASSTVNLDRGLVNMRLAMALEVATLGGGLAASLLSTQQLFLIFGATLVAMGALMMLRSGRRNVIADTSVDPGRLGGRL